MMNKLKRVQILFISTVLLFCYSNGFAQDEEQGGGFFSRCYIGGGFGAQFGDQTIISASPILGYKVTEKFHVGVGGTYIYYNFKQYYYDSNGNLQFIKTKSNIYGGSVFTKYFLFDEVFAYAEYGILNMEVFDPFSGASSRQNINSALIGGGYRQMLGESVGVELTILYDLIDDRNSPYSNPIIRLGIVAGF
ncbi:MAG: hypothetical protein ABI855_08120 [Bacteroidota bacterium]